MFVVKKLVIKNNSNIVTHTIDDFTPNEFENLFLDAVLNHKEYVIVADDDNEYLLNFGNLVRDIDISLDSWEAFANELTEEIIDGYTDKSIYVDSSLNLAKPVTLNHCDNTKYKLAYAIADSEYIGKFADRHRCHDLCIECNDTTVNMNSVLPIVNGYACRIKHSKSDMQKVYALSGVDLVTGVNTTPDVALLNYTNVGELKFFNLGYTAAANTARVTTNTKIGSSYHFNKNSILSITLPESYDLNEYFPIPVINGIIAMPDKIRISGSNSFTVDTVSIPVLTSVLRYNQLMNEYVDEYRRCVIANGYDKVQSDLVEGNTSSTFLVLVKGKLLIERTTLPCDFNSIDTNETGIVSRTSKQTIDAVIDQTYVSVMRKTYLADRTQFIDQDRCIKYEVSENELRLRDNEYLASATLDLIKLGGVNE